MVQTLTTLINSLLNNFAYNQNENNTDLINELLETQHTNHNEEEELNSIVLPAESVSPNIPTNVLSVDDSESSDDTSEEYESSEYESSEDESSEDESSEEIELTQRDSDLAYMLLNDIRIINHRNLVITSLPNENFKISFNHNLPKLNKNNKTCKCGSKYHLTNRSSQCPINKLNIMRVFNHLNIELGEYNFLRFMYDLRNHSITLTQNNKLEKFINIKITNYITKQNLTTSNDDEVKILKQKILKLQNEKKYLKNNNLIIDTADCELCCETVAVDNLYKSECSCKYKYCKPCYERLPKVYNNQHKLVRRCPTCRSVAL